jgi:hypothetical protein
MIIIASQQALIVLDSREIISYYMPGKEVVKRFKVAKEQNIRAVCMIRNAFEVAKEEAFKIPKEYRI